MTHHSFGKTVAIAFTAPLALALSSCGYAATGESDKQASTQSTPAPSADPFTVSEHGSFARPWAIEAEPGTGRIFVTEKAGTMKVYDPATGKTGSINGVPEVAYGGQGGLGDFVFAPDYATSKMVYLSWAQAGEGDTLGAVVGRGMLNCDSTDACAIEGLTIVWEQAPKVTGKGHYGHRIAFSPDGKHMFVGSSDRQKMAPAQDNSNTIGTIVRLNLDGTPAANNPMADAPAPTNQIWSYGHRNILGLAFNPTGQLWEVEHGPAGGDELNLVEASANYGWPIVSDGEHYNGDPIPNHSTRPEFATAAIGWTPVIAPGDMIFYNGDAFSAWKGDALIAGLAVQAVVHVKFNGNKAVEAARYKFDNRIRSIDEADDGSIWVAEDGEGGRLLKLTPAS